MKAILIFGALTILFFTLVFNSGTDWTVPIYDTGADVVVHGKLNGVVISHINKGADKSLGYTSDYVVLIKDGGRGELYRFKQSDLKSAQDVK